MATKQTTGILWGVNWERHTYGVYCYAVPQGAFYLASRKYVGNGSDPVSVKESVRAFRRDVLGIGGR